MSSQVHEFKMDMTCEGCAGAAKRVLTKKGVDESAIVTDVATKTVVVTSSLSVEELQEALEKTGKVITYLGTKM